MHITPNLQGCKSDDNQIHFPGSSAVSMMTGLPLCKDRTVSFYTVLWFACGAWLPYLESLPCTKHQHYLHPHHHLLLMLSPPCNCPLSTGQLTAILTFYPCCRPRNQLICHFAITVRFPLMACTAGSTVPGWKGLPDSSGAFSRGRASATAP